MLESGPKKRAREGGISDPYCTTTCGFWRFSFFFLRKKIEATFVLNIFWYYDILDSLFWKFCEKMGNDEGHVYFSLWRQVLSLKKKKIRGGWTFLARRWNNFFMVFVLLIGFFKESFVKIRWKVSEKSDGSYLQVWWKWVSFWKFVGVRFFR